MANGEQIAVQHWLDPSVPGQLRAELAAAQERRLTMEAERDELNSKLISLRTHIRKIQGLLGDDPLETEEFEREHVDPLVNRQGTSQVQPDQRTERILNIAEDILKQRGGADMHYSELADAVRKQGGNLPQHAKSRHDTLIRMMNEDPQQRFIRPKRRGFYALTADHPGTQSVGSRRPRDPD